MKYRTKLWNNNLDFLKMLQSSLNILQEMTMGNAKVLSPVVLTAYRPLSIYKFEEGNGRCLPYKSTYEFLLISLLRKEQPPKFGGP
jgi:hypothetical protein